MRTIELKLHIDGKEMTTTMTLDEYSSVKDYFTINPLVISLHKMWQQINEDNKSKDNAITI